MLNLRGPGEVPAGDYYAIPPATTSDVPVMYADSSLNKNATASTTSSTSPNLLRGTPPIFFVATTAGSRSKYGDPDAACNSFWRFHMKPDEGPINAGMTVFTLI